MLRATHLVKRYDGFEAVRDVSLHVPRGEIFGLLGPNGAGKTTTLKMCVGLLKPTSGQVTIAGTDVATHAEAVRRQLAYLPDEPLLYDRLTAREFMALVGTLYGVEREAQRRRTPELLERLGLMGVADRWAGSFSHGQKQRLALAAALLYEPRILFLDEPTVGLDPVGAAELKRLLRELAGAGVTIVVATHILEMAELLCTRVAVLARGRVEAEGGLEEIRAAAGLPGASLEACFLQLVGAA